MKKLMMIFLLMNISLCLFADSDIIVEQPESTGKKIKTILTSRPAQVVYGILVLGLGCGGIWLLYRCQEHESQELRYQKKRRDDLKNQAIQKHIEIQPSIVTSSVINTQLNGSQLDELFKKDGKEIKKYFFAEDDVDTFIHYSSNDKYQHVFMLKFMYPKYEKQLRKLDEALIACNDYRRQMNKEEIKFDALVRDNEMHMVYFNSPTN